jgi:hypothetical protein
MKFGSIQDIPEPTEIGKEDNGQTTLRERNWPSGGQKRGEDCKERAPVRTAATRTVKMREQRMIKTKKMMQELGEENRDR